MGQWSWMERRMGWQVSEFSTFVFIHYISTKPLFLRSREWSLLSEDEKREIGLTFDDDGEFWMSFKDFCSNYMKLEICNLNPDSLEEDDSQQKHWQTKMYEGSWAKGCSAGGCRNFLGTSDVKNYISLVILDLRRSWALPSYALHAVFTVFTLVSGSSDWTKLNEQ